ncbi:MAG TPA: aromatic ring hydroxylase [Anaerolineae bacterium]|nr:aromatic ring hydroxylase [Anaerolineae bacterium]
MITAQEYRERIKAMRPNVYIDGELVSRDDPRIEPAMNVIALTYDLPHEEQYEGIFTATSHLTGEKVNRFCHVHRSSDDLLKKQEMTRLYCHKSGGCIQRCMGIDAVNALSVITYEIDQVHQTEYHQRFLNYLEYFQKNDLCANCAQTDVKGDRKKRPHQQVDPDLYLRVVERTKDGIVVRGAKAHNTVAPYADEIVVVPTRFLTEEEADWAVAFAIPADAEGVKLICRPSAFRPRKLLDAPIARFGDVESLTIFDDVFVPWERVFMCGEREFAGPLALIFALYHRHSYTGCKPATSDVLMGMAALVAEYNGIEDEKHVQQKLADMISVAELVYAAGIAAAVKSQQAPSGTFVPEVIYSNVGRRHAGENIYHEFETVADLAGGLAATLPLEGDFISEETGPLLAKYIMRNPRISAEDQHRCFRLISDVICSSMGGVSQIAGLHGGGSPVMETITVLKNYDMEAKKRIAKELAGIKS